VKAVTLGLDPVSKTSPLIPGCQNASLSANRICALEEFSLPISGQAIVMEKQGNEVCGADIHKKFLVATILSRDGIKIIK
jgi:hypothetical protein